MEMANFNVSSSLSSSSSDESDFGTPSDDCAFCLAKLDPNNLVVNVKTLQLMADCVHAGCRQENRLGRWSCGLPVVVLK